MSGRRIILVVFVAIVAIHLDVVPIWDSMAYFRCVEEAVQKHPFDLLAFRCFGHPSILYGLLWAAPQYVWPWTPAPMYIVNAAVGVASIVAFDALLRLLFPGALKVEYTLVTSLYALAPLFVAHAIFLNLDFGATAFFVVFLYALVARRVWLASGCALAGMFTKETALPACVIAALAYVVAFVFRPGASWSQRLAELRAHAPLVSVPLVLATYLIVLALVRPDPHGWAAAYAPVERVSDRFEAIWNTNLADPSMRAYLTDMFILNFQWLYTAVVVGAACAAVIRVERPADAPNAVARRGLFVGLALAGLVYTVTRYRFGNGARYTLLASPVLILAFYHALRSLLTRPVTRIAYLTVCAAAVFLSNFRTLDVASRSIFGTFPFGSHSLLNITSLAGGLKLDALAYNLEFLQLQYLFGDMMRDLRPRPGSVLLMGNAIYYFPPDVDGRTYQLTAEPSHATPFFVAIGDVTRDVIASHVRRDGEPFFYLAFANADNEQLGPLRKTYPLLATKRYERFGYTLDLYTFRFSFAPEARRTVTSADSPRYSSG